MNNVEVLILHGSPGSGKSTLAAAVMEYLREAAVVNAVIDPDELSIVFPSQDADFSRRCLRAIWPIYSSIPSLKIIIPTVIKDHHDYEILTEALPASRFIICELSAPRSVLEERVTSREPNDYWQKRLLKWVAVYHQRDESQKFGDFQVSTDNKSIQNTAQEIIEKAGW